MVLFVISLFYTILIIKNNKNTRDMVVLLFYNENRESLALFYEIYVSFKERGVAYYPLVSVDDSLRQ